MFVVATEQTYSYCFIGLVLVPGFNLLEPYRMIGDPFKLQNIFGYKPVKVYFQNLRIFIHVTRN
jgi:hypothetical protein